MQKNELRVNFYTPVLNTKQQKLYNNLDDRSLTEDLQAVADIGENSIRIARCYANTLNTPYSEGLTGQTSSGIAYINMTSLAFGTIVYVVSGADRIFIRSKSNGVWRSWKEISVLT